MLFGILCIYNGEMSNWLKKRQPFKAASLYNINPEST